MADYLPIFKPGQAMTFKASAAVTGGQVVEISGSGTVAPTSAASAKFVGVAGFDGAVNDNVTVYADGVQHCTASGTIAAGALVESAAAGAVASHTNGTNDFNVFGLAVTAATNGQDVRVLVLR